MKFTGDRAVIVFVALSLAGGSSARAQFHTVRFLDPNAVPTGHLPDTGGILVPTSHNFQEDGVHVEAIWAPSTHVGFTQGHFHHLENGYETTHGFGTADAEGWYDLQGFYLRMVDGAPFALVSIDYRLRIDLLTTDILATAAFDPTQSFTGQFVHYPVGRFSTFHTLNFSGFENLTEVFISSIVKDPNREQIQFDNIVVYTVPPVFGACCPPVGLVCNQQTENDCVVDGGTYLGDNVPCTVGGFCPTRTGACCTPDGAVCSVKSPSVCEESGGAFLGLGTSCGLDESCPFATGQCCIENGASCLQVIEPACVGANTYFHGAGTQCEQGAECFVPCDSDADCDDADPCNGGETCNLASGVCQTGTNLNCDDADACTLDSCATEIGCEHAPIGCSDSDPCTVDACDSQVGCTNTPVVCTDDDSCNGLETCNPETGLCLPGSELECDDADACTSDSCDALEGCLHTAVDCNDQDACTLDTCDPMEGCRHEPRVCDDQDVCNGLEECNPQTGGCEVGTPLGCDDQNACTAESCDTVTGCSSTPVDCDDHDPCTNDGCDVRLGCKHVPVVCDDGNICNGLETCDPQDGSCAAGIPLECDDQDVCTFDKCSATTGCQHTRFECDDDDLCTQDSCDAVNGCVFAPVLCDDDDVCNGAETCNPKTGTCDAGDPLVCDDDNACTEDSCDVAGGCENVSVSCDDGDRCTTDSCDALTGCTHTPVTCDDGNICNGLELCNAETGACDLGEALECDDQDACTTDSCSPTLGCEHAALSCNDGDPCTVDSCESVLGCVHSAVICDDHDACTVDTCDLVKGCVAAPLTCDDQDACTVDSCDSKAGCSVEPLCDPGYACSEGDCSCIEPRGDRDGDGDRDLDDLTYFLPCMLGPADPAAPECECQDTNDDGDVDLLDLAEFISSPSGQ